MKPELPAYVAHTRNHCMALSSFWGDGPQEAGLKVEMLTSRLVPGERRDSDWGAGGRGAEK